LLAPFQRKLVDAWLAHWGGFAPIARAMSEWADAMTEFISPYTLNPLNLNPLRAHLESIVDFERLRASDALKLFIAATNVKTGHCEIFRRGILTPDHVMASACLPQLFQAVVIDGEPYWDGGFAGNPPLWPLFYETQCRDAIIVQINPIERNDTPETPPQINDRVNEITFNASLLAELRAADFVARLIRSGVLKSDQYRLERLHRIGGVGKLESYDAATKNDVGWPFLEQLRDLGRHDTKAWLEENFDAIGVRSTLDVDEALRREPPKPPTKGAPAAE
jgi:NTE family protein